jgi:outer membrane protein TolC
VDVLRVAFAVLVLAVGFSHAAAIAGQRRQPAPRPSAVTPANHAVTFTLADSIFLSLRRNRTIQSTHIDRTVQKFSLRVAEDRFNPQFEVEASAVRDRTGGIDSIAADVIPSVTLQLPTGGEFAFAWANAAAQAEQTRTSSSIAQLNFTQPLLRGAGRDVALAPLRMTQLDERILELQITQTVSETIANTIQAHRGVVAAQEELKLANAAVERAKETISVTRALIAAGRMAEVEIVQGEADLESQKLQVFTATQNLEAARLSLLSLLSLDLGIRLVAADDLAPRRVTTRLDRLMSVALEKRPDYAGQKLVIEQNRHGMIVAKNQQLWDLNFFASARFGESAIDEPGFSSRTRIEDARAGVTLTAPLNDLSRHQPFVQASAASQKAELQFQSIRQGLEQQVRLAASSVEIGWKQLEVARRARQLSAQAIDIEKDKLKSGRSSSFQVRLLEGELRAADARLLSSQINYLNALTLLDLALGTTLDTWQIKIPGADEPLPWAPN